MVTPLARRRPWKVARETVALDRLSRGRFVLGVGLGIHDEEFAHLGEADTARGRAALLDEALDVITDLWTGERVDHHGPAFDVDAWFRPGPPNAKPAPATPTASRSGLAGPGRTVRRSDAQHASTAPSQPGHPATNLGTTWR